MGQLFSMETNIEYQRQQLPSVQATGINHEKTRLKTVHRGIGPSLGFYFLCNLLFITNFNKKTKEISNGKGKKEVLKRPQEEIRRNKRIRKEKIFLVEGILKVRKKSGNRERCRKLSYEIASENTRDITTHPSKDMTEDH